MPERRHYFLEDAWEKYRDYIEEVNSGDMRRHLSFVIYPEIIDVTHPQNGGYDYKAKGFFSEWGPTYRDIHKIGEFELELSFIYRGDKASDVLFTDWNVKMSDAPESKQQSLLERARKLRP